MKVKDENDLHEMGFAIDPNDPAQAIPIKSLAELQPNENWDIEALARFVSSSLAEGRRLESETDQLSRRSTVQVFRAGHALSIAREKLKAERKWCEWLSENNIPRTNAWEAIELFQRARSEGAIANLTLSEAKHKYGVTKGGRGTSFPCDDQPADDGAPSLRLYNGGEYDDVQIEEDVAGSDGQSWPCEDEADRRIDFDECALPKEHLESLSAVLVEITRRLECCETEVAAIDWSEESPETFLFAIDEMIGVLRRIQQKIPIHA